MPAYDEQFSLPRGIVQFLSERITVVLVISHDLVVEVVPTTKSLGSQVMAVYLILVNSSSSLRGTLSIYIEGTSTSSTR